MIEVGDFFQDTGFDIAGFAKALHQALETTGLPTSNSFSNAQLGYIENKEQRILNCIPIDELLSFLEHQGVDGMDSLTAPFRFYLDAIHRRSDIAAILQHFKALSARRTVNAGGSETTLLASQ